MNEPSMQQALETLQNASANSLERERAIRYLAEHPNREAIQRLIDALEDDDFGIRWEAALALARTGRDGLVALLAALTDPERVGHSRLRRSAYRALEHLNLPGANPEIWSLMTALKGPASEIATMKEAYNLLQVLHKGAGSQL